MAGFVLTQSRPIALAFVVLIGIVVIMPFSVVVALGQDYLPNRIRTASGVTVGLAVSAGGLATPALGWLADATSLRTTLTAMIALPLVALLLSTSLNDPVTNRKPLTQHPMPETDPRRPVGYSKEMTGEVPRLPARNAETMITVSRLQLAPVKSLALVLRQVVQLEMDGVAEDRRLFLRDVDGGVVTQRRHPELARVGPELDPANGTLTVTFQTGRRPLLRWERSRSRRPVGCSARTAVVGSCQDRSPTFCRTTSRSRSK